LLSLIGCRVALDEQKFGPQQTAPLGAAADRSGRIARTADIGEYLNAGAIAGATVGLGRHALARLGCASRTRVCFGARQHIGCGGDLKRPLIGIDNQQRALRNLVQLLAQANQHRHVGGSGKNGHVRGGTATGEADCRQTLGVERDELRRQQIIGKQHCALGQVQIHRSCLAGERQQHVRFDIL
jgi:hypothetical protein